MGTSIKHTGKILASLTLAYLVLLFPAKAANALPTAEDINALAEKTTLTTDTFMQESFKLRMEYEYRGKFAGPDDKENLNILAKNAGDRLAAIAEKQKTLKLRK